jgi:predicted phage tail protein
MSISAKYIPCLFDDRTWVEFESHNQTPIAIVWSLLNQHPEVKKNSGHLVIRVNGKKISQLAWIKPLRPDDRVTIIQDVGFEAIVAVLGGAAAISTALTGSAAAAATISTIATIADIAFTVATIAYSLYTVLAQPGADKTGRGLLQSATYGWDGAQMQIAAGIPVPIVYGKARRGGNVVGGLR